MTLVRSLSGYGSPRTSCRVVRPIEISRGSSQGKTGGKLSGKGRVTAGAVLPPGSRFTCPIPDATPLPATLTHLPLLNQAASSPRDPRTSTAAKLLPVATWRRAKPPRLTTQGPADHSCADDQPARHPSAPGRGRTAHLRFSSPARLDCRSLLTLSGNSKRERIQPLVLAAPCREGASLVRCQWRKAQAGEFGQGRKEGGRRGEGGRGQNGRRRQLGCRCFPWVVLCCSRGTLSSGQHDTTRTLLTRPSRQYYRCPSTARQCDFEYPIPNLYHPHSFQSIT